MTTTWLRTCFAVLAVTAAPIAPPARAADGVRSAAELTPQEKDMVSLAADFARRCADALERWIASKEVTEEMLFSSLYYPIPSTDPPKFTTDWDKLSDRDIQAIEETILGKSPSMFYAVMVDRHGYLPTHNQRYSLPMTGNLANDLVNNRTKRIFNDRTGIAAARSQAPFLIQRYQRDTGETMADVSVPLVVRGVHWGAVRIGYRPSEGR